jgi:hypothetical protein
MEFEWEISVFFQHGERDVMYYWGANIYSIDDTASVHWNTLWGNTEDYPLEFHIPYFWYGNEQRENNGKEVIRMIDYQLTVTDSIVQAMQKDYTLLHKFSEYYE